MRVERRIAIGVICLIAAAPAVADHLVFGSFRSQENASNWAAKLTSSFAEPISVNEVIEAGVTWFRVQSGDLEPAELEQLARRARANGIQFWRKSADPVVAEALAEEVEPPLGAPRLTPPSRIDEPVPATPDAGLTQLNWDLGLQSRAFADEGFLGQDRLEGSLSASLEFYRAWDRDRQSVTVTPFVRIDSADDERTHFDMRELFYSRVGDNWDFHVGAKRVFWGVTEFHHLVDIVNQTDLVENIDTEDKLGQPMAQLSLVRDFGIVDLYLLPYFRERTFPSTDGRLGFPLEVDDDARYESGAKEHHVDVALRWSHYLGPWEFGISHFSGTSRDPILEPRQDGSGAWALVPYYPLIEQTAIDAQALVGDWAFKLEGFNRSGFADTYHAFNIGFERTIVGVLGTRADLGVVVEYMYDERGDEAFNTIFEQDLALGARMQLNDLAGTQALIGVIVDTDNQDRVISIEASRRFGSDWTMTLEGRVFGDIDRLPADADVGMLMDVDFKSAILATEDYLQLELKKHF